MENINIIITALAAIIAAIAGVYYSNWLKRPKPWIGISSIDRDDTTLVDVSSELQKNTAICHYTNALSSKEPLNKLKELSYRSSSLIGLIKSTIDKVNSFEKKIKNNELTTIDEKRKEIATLLSDELFTTIIENNNRKGSLPLPEKIDKENNENRIFKVDDLTGNNDTEKVLILYGKDNRLYLSAGKGLIGPETIRRTKLLTEVFNSFILDYIEQILSIVRDELQSDYHYLIEISDRLTDTIKSRALIIKAKASNFGGKPVHIEPYGILNINSTGKKINPVFVECTSYRLFEAGVEDLPRMFQIMEGMAKKQGIEPPRTPPEVKGIPEYIIVNPGQLVEIEFSTIDSVDESSVIPALEAGMLSSQLVLKLVSKKGKKSLIKSSFQTMGLRLSDEKRKEMETYI